MVIVLGSVKIEPDKIDTALKLSLEHVARSRAEPGCIAHAVYRDVENDQRLAFVEKWSDRNALRAHFQVPESKQFVEDLALLCAEKPVMSIFLAEELPH